MASKDPEALFEACLNYVERNQIQHVFLMAYWSSYQKQVGSEMLEEMILATVEQLSEAGAKVYILMGVPTYDTNVARGYLRESFFGLSRDSAVQGQTAEKYKMENSAILGAKRRNELATFIDPTVHLWNADHDVFKVIDDNKLLYWDSNHLTQHGVHTVWSPTLTGVLESIRKRRDEQIN